MGIDSSVLPMVDADGALILQGENYLATLFSLIEKANSKIWGSFFIMNLDAETPNLHRIKELADALIRAAHRGVDVRLILGNFNVGAFDFDTNLVPLHFLHEKGVAVKQYKSEFRSTNHCKDWIFDRDKQISGSGNLSIGGLFSNKETAILVQSETLNRLLSSRFNSLWNTSVLPNTTTVDV